MGWDEAAMGGVGVLRLAFREALSDAQGDSVIQQVRACSKPGFIYQSNENAQSDKLLYTIAILCSRTPLFRGKAM